MVNSDLITMAIFGHFSEISGGRRPLYSCFCKQGAYGGFLPSSLNTCFTLKPILAIYLVGLILESAGGIQVNNYVLPSPPQTADSPNLIARQPSFWPISLAFLFGFGVALRRLKSPFAALGHSPNACGAVNKTI